MMNCTVYTGHYHDTFYEIKEWLGMGTQLYAAYMHLPYAWVAAKMNTGYDDNIKLRYQECTFRETRTRHNHPHAVIGWDYQHFNSVRPLAIDQILIDVQLEIDHMLSLHAPDQLRLIQMQVGNTDTSTEP